MRLSLPILAEPAIRPKTAEGIAPIAIETIAIGDPYTGQAAQKKNQIKDQIAAPTATLKTISRM